MSGSLDHVPTFPRPVLLARRRSSGMTVSLLWDEKTNSVTVLVCDGRMTDPFELAVEPHMSPLDVFEHPYAYAAWCGIDYELAEEMCGVTADGGLVRLRPTAGPWDSDVGPPRTP